MTWGPFEPAFLIADIFRGTVGAIPRRPPAHQLPLCTYCDHSHHDHWPDAPSADALRRCHADQCECLDFRDPDVHGGDNAGQQETTPDNSVTPRKP